MSWWFKGIKDGRLDSAYQKEHKGEGAQTKISILSEEDIKASQFLAKPLNPFTLWVVVTDDIIGTTFDIGN